MYDLDYSARCAGNFAELKRRDGVGLCAGAEADGVCLCTMYEVRCTIWIIARVARDCRAGA